MANRWDERYSAEDYAYGTEPNDFLRQTAGRIPAGEVLCLADGEGRNGVYLAELGYAVSTVDGSAVGVEKAKRLAAERQVPLNAQVADLAVFSIPKNRWSGIVSIFAHVPPEIRRPLHRGVLEGLVPGGLFILEAYRPAQLEFGTGGPPDAALMMTLADLKRELAGLEFLHAEETERDVYEGRFHTGRAAVVQLLARKPG